MESRVPLGGICDIESARSVAKRLFETYDKDRNGQLDNMEGRLLIDLFLVAPMMVDAYRGMSKGFNPSKSDIETYTKILDKNGDGKVTL